MTPDRDATAAMQRLGVGLLVGALLLVALAEVVLAEIAALLVLGVGLASYALERRVPRLAGLWAGLVGAALFLVVDRQVDPVGATVARSVAVTAVVGLAVLATALAVGSDLPDRLRS